jgi:hypothetical protein
MAATPEFLKVSFPLQVSSEFENLFTLRFFQKFVQSQMHKFPFGLASEDPKTFPYQAVIDIYIGSRHLVLRTDSNLLLHGVKVNGFWCIGLYRNTARSFEGALNHVLFSHFA